MITAFVLFEETDGS